MSPKNPYDQAIDRFEALNAAIMTPTTNARDVIKQAGLPLSSGYRILTQFEQRGFAKRDTAGRYLRGDVAWQIGMAAFGFGSGMAAVLPLVRYLRTQTLRTAFIGVRQRQKIHVGPFSKGRGAEFVSDPQTSYEFTSWPDDALDIELRGQPYRLFWAAFGQSAPDIEAGLAVISRPVPDLERQAVANQVRAAAQMAMAARALTGEHI